MSKLPSMPLFVDAYLADTTHLSLEEHGAYLLLLMAMWRRGGQIENSDRDIARMLGLMPRAWRLLKARLMPLLSVYGPDDLWITQKRLQKTWNYAVENSAKKSESGKAGAKVRWERKQLLSSSERIGTGNGNSNGKTIASINRKNNTFLPTTSREENGCEENDQKPAQKIEPETRALSHLLRTNLMRQAR